MLLPNHSRVLLGSSIAFLSLGTLVGYSPQARAIEITIDYNYDDSNFFSDINRQALLNQAASYFTGFSDQLSPLPTSTYTITDPSNTSQTIAVSTDLQPNEIIIFAGSDPTLSTIGEGGSTWVLPPSVRGQSDFAPAVGFISFDPNADWYFGTTTSGLAGSGQYDFLSTAIHEIAHVMGFGTAPTWDALVQSNQFTGKISTDIFGGNIPLAPDGQHWVDGTQSTAKGVLGEVETAMDPVIDLETRKLLTDLDYAGLQDIGWEVNSSVYSSSVPFEFSPSLGIFFVAGMFGTRKIWSTCKSKK